MIRFPHANNFQVSDELFVACWQHVIGSLDDIPRSSTRNPLGAYIGTAFERSLEFVCRIQVPLPYRNTAQATRRFMAANAHLLEEVLLPSMTSRRRLVGARLLAPAEAAKTICQLEAEAVMESLEEEVLPLQSGPPPSAMLKATGLSTWVASFVDDVHSNPFQPSFHRRPYGAPVTGWANRLNCYFWPNPGSGVYVTHAAVAVLTNRFRPLATSAAGGLSWTATQQNQVVQLATDIFAWGSVPQDPGKVTAVNIESVVKSAISKSHVGNALMNSGWTKVAAFASDHLEGMAGTWPEVIWDSRVATSIISRLDRLAVLAGHAAVPNELAGIGRVDSGRGGTRPRTNVLRWPNGYGSWTAQLSGSLFVAAVRDHLNANPSKYGLMPSLVEGGAPTKWTVRGVEMVLFMDGY